MILGRNMLLFFLQHLVMISGQVQLSGHHQHHLHHSLHTDKIVLLDIKKSLEPNSNLSNWNETNDVCNFTGVICKNRHRVSQLILSGVGLEGRLPPLISNLTYLRIIDLTDNRLSGIIPHEISHLCHLHTLLLDGNNLHGPLSDSFSLLSNLSFLSLSNNSLTGTIPPSLFSNCTSLANLDLSQNYLFGKIPAEIGNCPNLWNLNLYNNQFTGQIPLSLTNASTMYSLDVEYNRLSGELPSELVSQFPELGFLHLSYTNMVSHDGNNNLATFFSALANCTRLKELELAGMGLGGSLPSSIGQLSKKLKIMLLQENHIYGSVPPSFSNLSSLASLNLTGNFLNGTIFSPEISNMKRLERLFLAYNHFTGKIPAALGRIPHLGLLDLSNNRFSGKIPEGFGNLVEIRFLFLNNNYLSGEIPPSLGKCKDLSSLDLSHNRLTGNIPPDISGLHEIRIFLNLSHNFLEGPLPLELSKLANVQEIDLSSNYLHGRIFGQISSCIALEIMNLSNNSFQGQLPESLGDLKNLKAFDVSRNELSGKIPTGLSKIRTLNFLNLSSNNFEGPIPSGGVFSSVTYLSFLKNPRLCGPILGIPACSRRRKYFHSRVFFVIFCIVISVSVLLSIMCCVIGRRYLKAILISTTRFEPERKSTPDVMHNFPRMTYKELSEATGGFDDQRLVGSGGYGHVYKGVLPDGTAIAVKVLQLQTGNSTKSFNRECQVLKRIRHRNLIRIITACSLPDFKALVLPFMANGSLDSRLYPHPRTGLGSGSSDLNLIQRVNICSDIAEGMAYLHHHSPVRVIHCDLKPSNVLLNDDMTALVSDFGIARLVMTVGGGNVGAVENTGNSMTNMLSGSIGYIAPEYGFGSSISTKGDVYSFGILVLEMVTRKRPTDDMFVGGLSLPRWVKTHYHGQIEKVIDSSLVRAVRDQSPDVKKMWEVAIGELFELGILCTQDTLFTRPTMLDAADDLDRLKRYLNGDTTATFASSLGISSSTLSDDWNF